MLCKPEDFCYNERREKTSDAERHLFFLRVYEVRQSAERIK